jgi:hypothetical protein
VRRAAWLLGAVASLLLVVTGPSFGQAPPAEPRWFKGNTHTHTVNSDGDSTPDEVVRWYREQGYHFLVLTDHNFATPVDGLNSVFAAEDRFVVVAGEEITDRAGDKPIHVNALGLARTIRPAGGAAAGEVLGTDVEAARTGAALPQINHPNFGWAVGPADVRTLKGVCLLEIFNGHPQVNNLGGGGAPSAEALWDEMLSAGQTVHAVATDDLHALKRPGVRQAAGPGRGWVVVRARRLTASDILAALERGEFYASTGVELADVETTPQGLAVTVREQGTTRFRTEFIGYRGRVLLTVDGASARYTFVGNEGYVRARVLDSNGLAAWTQPVRVGRPEMR